MDAIRKVGVPCKAAWRMKHKIMQTMLEREDEKPHAGTWSKRTMSISAASSQIRKVSA